MRHPTNTARTERFGWVAGYPLNKNYNAPGKPASGDYGFHMGTDYAYSDRDPYVYAPEDGEVSFVPNNGTLGNAVYLQAGNRYWAFGHNSSFLAGIDNGDWVVEGEKLAVMGETGAAYGKHCHAALRENGVLVDAWELIQQHNKENDKVIIPDNDNWHARFNKLMQQIRNRDVSRSEFKSNFVGVEAFTMVEVLSDHPDADAATELQAVGTQARTENWQGQIVDLKKEIEYLKASAGEDTTKLNALGEALKWLIKRLGITSKESSK